MNAFALATITAAAPSEGADVEQPADRTTGLASTSDRGLLAVAGIGLVEPVAGVLHFTWARSPGRWPHEVHPAAGQQREVDGVGGPIRWNCCQSGSLWRSPPTGREETLFGWCRPRSPGRRRKNPARIWARDCSACALRAQAA